MKVYFVIKDKFYWSTDLDRWTLNFEEAECFTNKKWAESHANEKQYKYGKSVSVVSFVLIPFIEIQSDLRVN